MIIKNGTLEMRTNAPSGIDPETGYAVEPSVMCFDLAAGFDVWRKPVDCQIVPGRLNLQGKERNGEATFERNYTIYIEGTQHAPFEQVRLKDLSGQVVGEYSVISIRVLRAVNQTEIVV